MSVVAVAVTVACVCVWAMASMMLKDAVRLNLFSFSLAGEAKRWLHSFKGNSLKTCEEVVEKFLKKYFPESKTAKGMATISSFSYIDSWLTVILTDGQLKPSSNI